MLVTRERAAARDPAGLLGHPEQRGEGLGAQGAVQARAHAQAGGEGAHPAVHPQPEGGRPRREGDEVAVLDRLAHRRRVGVGLVLLGRAQHLLRARLRPVQPREPRELLGVLVVQAEDLARRLQAEEVGARVVAERRELAVRCAGCARGRSRRRGAGS